MLGHDAVIAWYRRYNAICNRHAFDELGPFLRDVVLVNGTERTAQQYADDLFVVVDAFPCTAWSSAGSPRSG
jgi:predicted ester cyclase